MGSDLGTLSLRCLQDILIEMCSRQVAIESKALERSFLEIANWTSKLLGGVEELL